MFTFLIAQKQVFKTVGECMVGGAICNLHWQLVP